MELVQKRLNSSIYTFCKGIENLTIYSNKMKTWFLCPENTVEMVFIRWLRWDILIHVVYVVQLRWRWAELRGIEFVRDVMRCYSFYVFAIFVSLCFVSPVGTSYFSGI